VILIYPSGRPAYIQPAIRRALQTAPDVKVLVAVGYNSDTEYEDFNDSETLLFRYYGPDMCVPGFIKLTNQLYRLAVGHFDVQAEELVGFWSDDFYPSVGWARPLIQAARSFGKPCLIQPNDGIQKNGDCATIPFASRDWWDLRNGGCIWPPIYQRFSCDDDIAFRAKRAKEYVYLPTLTIGHHHFITGRRRRDKLDADSEKFIRSDGLIFRRRKHEIQTGGKWVTW